MPMPRLTDQPSGMSRATRAASSSRVQGFQFGINLSRLRDKTPTPALPRLRGRGKRAPAPAAPSPASGGGLGWGLRTRASRNHYRRVAGRQMDDAVDIDAGRDDHLG